MVDTPSMMLSVRAAVQEVRAGRMVLIRDDEGRENEADLCLAAQFATPEAVNFLVRQACGLLCVALAGERLDALQIPQEAHQGQPLQGTAFSVSVDARQGTTTGISVSDRAITIRALVNPMTRPDDLARPGHVFPLRARPGGTLERRGHTEAAVDLMRIAGLEPGATICEVLDEQGEPARGAALLDQARRWGIGIVHVDDIARFRHEHAVSLVAQTTLPLAEATFTVRDYCELASGQHFLALLLNYPPEIQTAHEVTESEAKPLLLRLHSACATGDIFGSRRCDCQSQLHAALRAIAAEGHGILLYLPQEGRGIGLTAKLQAYALQDQGFDTVNANTHLGYPADARSYETAIAILRELGVSSARLLTNNPCKVEALEEAGITVERVPLEGTLNESNSRYLETKSRQLGHLLSSLTSIATSSSRSSTSSSLKGESDDPSICSSAGH